MIMFTLPIMASCNQVPLSGNPQSDPSRHLPTLADLLTIETSATIFYSYARELELSRIFAEQDIGDDGKGITLLVPNNRAVMALAHKPWACYHSLYRTDGITNKLNRHEDMRIKEQDVRITQEQFEDISRENIERWVQAHIIPVCPHPAHSLPPVFILLLSVHLSPSKIMNTPQCLKTRTSPSAPCAAQIPPSQNGNGCAWMKMAELRSSIWNRYESFCAHYGVLLYLRADNFW